MNIEAVMKCIDDVLGNPLAGKGSLTVSELIRDRLTAISATEPGAPTKKDAPPKSRKPRRTKVEMQAARADAQNDPDFAEVE